MSASDDYWTSIRSASRLPGTARRDAVIRAAHERGIGVAYIAHAARLSVSRVRQIVAGNMECAS